MSESAFKATETITTLRAAGALERLSAGAREHMSRTLLAGLNNPWGAPLCERKVYETCLVEMARRHPDVEGYLIEDGYEFVAMSRIDDADLFAPNALTALGLLGSDSAREFLHDVIAGETGAICLEAQAALELSAGVQEEEANTTEEVISPEFIATRMKVRDLIYYAIPIATLAATASLILQLLTPSARNTFI